MSEMWRKSLLAAGWNRRKAAELAVEIEGRGVDLYRALAAKWEGTASLRALFTKLAEDEAEHRDDIGAILSIALASRSDASSALDEEGLKAIARGFFSETDGALRGIEALTGREEILEKVLRFENATVLYYRGLQDVLGRSPTLDAMIAQEKRHAVEIRCALGRPRPA